MSVDATKWAWSLSIPPSRKIVLLSMADRAGESHTCWPSVARLESDTCLDRKTILAAISDLENMGLVSVSRSLGQGNCYQLIGVSSRETSPKNGTATSPKNGTAFDAVPVPILVPVPKTEPHQSQKRDTHQSQKRDTEPTNEPIKNLNTNTSAVAQPDGVSDLVWSDFNVLRSQKKAKLTATALAGIQAQADEAGWTLEAALSECCARGWTGFKAAWVSEKPQAARPVQQMSFAERDRIAGMQQWEEMCNRRHPDLPEEFSKHQVATNVVDITPAELRISQ